MSDDISVGISPGDLGKQDALVLKAIKAINEDESGYSEFPGTPYRAKMLRVVEWIETNYPRVDMTKDKVRYRVNRKFQPEGIVDSEMSDPIDGPIGTQTFGLTTAGESLLTEYQQSTAGDPTMDPSGSTEELRAEIAELRRENEELKSRLGELQGRVTEVEDTTNRVEDVLSSVGMFDQSWRGKLKEIVEYGPAMYLMWRDVLGIDPSTLTSADGEEQAQQITAAWRDRLGLGPNEEPDTAQSEPSD